MNTEKTNGESTLISFDGAGNQTRSFCYVGDLFDGLMRLMQIPYSAAKSCSASGVV
jgi:nucleoside-diphosphate-sugar epimerase